MHACMEYIHKHKNHSLYFIIHFDSLYTSFITRIITKLQNYEIRENFLPQKFPAIRYTNVHTYESVVTQ